MTRTGMGGSFSEIAEGCHARQQRNPIDAKHFSPHLESALGGWWTPTQTILYERPGRDIITSC